MPYEDCNGPLLRGDPLLDRPQYQPPGWFAGIEVDIVGAHIKNRLVGPVSSAIFSDVVRLPGAELDWVGSPRVELGYRLPQGAGAIVLCYHSLVTDGLGVLPGFDLDGSDGVVRSRLNLNSFDIDYASQEYSLLPYWDMRWKAGVRIAGVFFDSLGLGQFREQRSSNNFVGAGPHIGLELQRYLHVPGLAAYGRLDAAVVIGEIDQSFEEQFVQSDGTVVGAASRFSQTQAVPVVHFQAGLTWSPPGTYHWLRFSGGYELENWWYLGQLGSMSRAELTTQGIFLRAQWDF
jgi:hypothetical protein